jgi:hypothetical protein
MLGIFLLATVLAFVISFRSDEIALSKAFTTAFFIFETLDEILELTRDKPFAA